MAFLLVAFSDSCVRNSELKDLLMTKVSTLPSRAPTVEEHHGPGASGYQRLPDSFTDTVHVSTASFSYLRSTAVSLVRSVRH